MYMDSLREGGPFAIETYNSLSEVERPVNFSQFEIASCAVVYADKSQVLHSVRIFKFEEARS